MEYGLFSSQQAAVYLGITKKALQNMRLRGDGPKYVKFGKNLVMYRREAIEEWIEARTKSSTRCEAGA